MRSEVRKLLRLTEEERRSLARAWACLLVADVALRILPIRRVEGLLAWFAGSQPKPGIPVGHLAHMVGVAARRHLWPITCLPRALVLQALLHRQGISAELRIGVRRENNVLEAHAWLEEAGQPVGDRSDIGELYLPLARVGRAS